MILAYGFWVEVLVLLSLFICCTFSSLTSVHNLLVVCFSITCSFVLRVDMMKKLHLHVHSMYEFSNMLVATGNLPVCNSLMAFLFEKETIYTISIIVKFNSKYNSEILQYQHIIKLFRSWKVKIWRTKDHTLFFMTLHNKSIF